MNQENTNKMQIIITASPEAKVRTRNRLHEHGNQFIELERGNPNCMNNAASILIRTIDNQWRGWLPLSEINVSQCT